MCLYGWFTHLVTLNVSLWFVFTQLETHNVSLWLVFTHLDTLNVSLWLVFTLWWVFVLSPHALRVYGWFLLYGFSTHPVLTSFKLQTASCPLTS